MELRNYLRFFTKWLWVVLLSVVTCGGASYLVSVNLPRTYESSVTLLVQQASTANGPQYTDLLTSQTLAKTYGEMLTKRPVLDDVIRSLDLDTTPEELSSQIDVELLRDTQLIAVKVRSSDPGRARSVANQLAKSFITQISSLHSTNLNSAKSELQREIDRLRSQIDAGMAELETFRLSAAKDTADSAAEAEISKLQSQTSQDQVTYVNLLKSYQEIELAQARTVDTVTVVEPAVTPTIPVSPKPVLNAVLAVVLGLIIGVAIGMVMEYVDDTIKNAEDVARGLSVPMLATIARARGVKEYGQALFAQHNSKAPIAEAYRMLRTNILFSSLDKPITSILVTSTNPSEGKSVTAANLAVVFAQAGKKVILVDSDLRKPTQHSLFSTDNSYGLTTLLLEDQPDIGSVIRQTPIENLWLITSGPIPPSPSEILGSRRMEVLLKYLKRQADILIFDSPPVLAVTDSTVIASKVGGAVLVAKSGGTRREAALQAIQSLSKVGCTVLGVVLNKVPANSDDCCPHYRYSQPEEPGGTGVPVKSPQQNEARAG